MGVPISILIDQHADGRFHATAPDHPDIVVDAETLDILFQNLHARLSPIFTDGSRGEVFNDSARLENPPAGD